MPESGGWLSQRLLSTTADGSNTKEKNFETLGNVDGTLGGQRKEMTLGTKKSGRKGKLR